MASELEERLGFGELFSKSWSVFKDNWQVIISIMFASGMVWYLSSAILGLPLNQPIDQAEPINIKPGNTFIFLIISVLVQLLATMAIALVVELSVKKQPVNFNEVLRQAFSRLFGGVWTSILAGIIVFALCLLLIIPGIIWAVYYVFAVNAVVLRGLSGREALSYSKGLVKGNWFNVFGSIIFFIVITMLVVFFPAILFLTGFEYFLPVSSEMAQIILNVLALPFQALVGIFITLLFLNLDYCRSGANTLKSAKYSK